MKKNKILSLFLALIMTFSVFSGAFSVLGFENKTTNDSILGILSTVSASYANTIDEWSLIALADYNSAAITQTQKDAYVAALKARMVSAQALLYETSATNYEVSAITLAKLSLDALQFDHDGDGSDGTVTGTAPINFYKKIANYGDPSFDLQTVSGYIYALAAYDAGGYDPSADHFTKDLLKTTILSFQHDDGGWTWSTAIGEAELKKTSDVDMTAIALLALAPYKAEPAIATAIDEALAFLQTKQQSSGGFKSADSEWNGTVYPGSENPDTTAAVLEALTALSINAASDARFIKNNNTLLDAIVAYKTDDGTIAYTIGGATNAWSTRSVFRALAAYNKKYPVSPSSQTVITIDNAVLSETPTEVASGSKTPLSITATDAVSVPQIKLTSLTSIENGTKKEAILPKISISRTLPDSGNKVILIDIPEGTKVTGPDAWDGTIILGKKAAGSDITTLGVNDTLSTGVILGSTAYELSFSKPVRILFQGDGGKRVGVIRSNSTNSSGEITTALSADSFANAISSLTSANYGKITVGSDLATYAKTFSKFYTYTTWTAPVIDPNTGSGAGGGATTSKVYLRVADPKGSEMLSKKSFDFSDDMTALGLLKKAGLSVNTDSNGTYVTSIGGLAQFDHGSESGWMYRVNGTFGSVSAASYSLKANDFVEFLYTRDLGKDIGGYVEEKKDTTSSLSEEDKETLENVLAKVVQNIKTKMTLSDFEYLLLGLYDGSFLKEADFVARVKEANGSYSKATDLERTILAVRAAGLNPANVEGINLLESLVNFSDIEKQGANGAIFALLAYDATGLKLPKTDALSRTVLKEKILSYQKTDGGFALSKIGDSDVDITAMALTALAPYQKESAVKSAVAKAVSYLEKQQQTDGGFLSYSVASSESTSQVIIALASLGIDPADTRFVKNKTTLLTNLYSFKKSDGTFAHIKGKESDEMATYQAGLALLAYQRFLDKGKNLFDMSGKTLVSYNDLSKVSSWATDSVKACKQAFLMSGDANNNFNPTDTLKRSETAKIMVELLKLPKTETKIAFSDVSDAAWYRPYVDTAADAGIVNGIGNYKFDPNGEITRQDFAVMIVRAVGIEKTDTTMPSDISIVAPYAQDAVQAIYSSGLMVGSSGKFDPYGKLSREMAATILMRIYENYFE